MLVKGSHLVFGPDEGAGSEPRLEWVAEISNQAVTSNLCEPSPDPLLLRLIFIHREASLAPDSKFLASQGSSTMGNEPLNKIEFAIVCATS